MRTKVAEGNEIRGFSFRVYPTAADEESLLAMQVSVKQAWNQYCSWGKQTYEATRARAEKLGISYDCAKKLPECCYRNVPKEMGVKWDYQALRRVIDDKECHIPLLQAVSKHYIRACSAAARGGGVPRFKKKRDSAPIKVGTGKCFRLGEFGARGKNPTFYNCEVRLNGLRLKGRLPGREPPGRVLEGVSLRKRPSGWFASVSVEVPKRVLPPVVPGTAVGIDVGLVNLAAIAGALEKLEPNRRGLDFIERIAGRQAVKKDVGRLHERLRAHTRHQIFNEVIKPIEKAGVAQVFVEDLPADIGQRGNSRVSAMRTVHSLLRERFGDRVKSVDPAYTSQVCSKCGELDKNAWSPRIGTCKNCGHSEDRDMNAARNILDTGLGSLRSGRA